MKSQKHRLKWLSGSILGKYYQILEDNCVGIFNHWRAEWRGDTHGNVSLNRIRRNYDGGYAAGRAHDHGTKYFDARDRRLLVRAGLGRAALRGFDDATKDHMTHQAQVTRQIRPQPHHMRRHGVWWMGNDKEKQKKFPQGVEKE